MPRPSEAKTVELIYDPNGGPLITNPRRITVQSGDTLMFVAGKSSPPGASVEVDIREAGPFSHANFKSGKTPPVHVKNNLRNSVPFDCRLLAEDGRVLGSSAGPGGGGILEPEPGGVLTPN